MSVDTIDCACGLAKAVYEGCTAEGLEEYHCPHCGTFYIDPKWEPDNLDINRKAQEQTRGAFDRSLLDKE
jgi:hypothetical protein